MKNWQLNTHSIRLNSSGRLYQINIPIVAITGGIATGKSTFTNYLASKGFSVLNADHLVKKIYKEPSVIKSIDKLVPGAMKNDLLEMDFPLLRKRFFSDETLKQKVEEIIYNKLPDAFLDELKSLRSLKKDLRVILYDIPLLFEKNLHPYFDLTVCVSVTPESQVERLIKRDSID